MKNHMIMKPNSLKAVVVAGLASVLSLTACNDYLNVVPNDGNATIETAFNLRSTAIRYLGTCYSFMTQEGNIGMDPAFLGSDELVDLWGRVVSNTSGRVPFTMSNIARGFQNTNNVYGYDWSRMYQGIRACDILMDNVDKVPDLQPDEKARWIAETKFLKAYYHFNLIRKYGPIPIVRHSLPMESSVDEVRVFRDPIDSCFNYALALINEAIPDLPQTVDIAELGRITAPIALSMKAKIAAYAASPLFNGNPDQAMLIDSRGIKLFPNKTEEEKKQRWIDAMNYCKEAIDACHKANIKLYTWDDEYRVNDTLKLDFTLRGTMCERWNSELIWGNTQTSKAAMLILQQMAVPNLQFASTGWKQALSCYAFIGVPLKVAEEFYSKNGVPIQYDKERKGWNEFELQDGDSTHQYYLEQGYTTIKLNFNREPRFYAFLGFDGGKWVGALQNYNDLKSKDIFDVECRMGKSLAKSSSETGPVTGYFPKKIFPYRQRMPANNQPVSTYYYPWPELRLADLYLLYAEAINEAEGPTGAHSQEMFAAIDSVRSRANIPDVRTAWDNYSTSPGKYGTQAGMREIIHQERMIELCFESQRFYDLRRWKEAPTEYAKHIYGFTITGFNPEDYYKKLLIYEQPFTLRDYFWPISTYDMEHDINLVQNLGW